MTAPKIDRVHFRIVSPSVRLKLLGMQGKK